MRTLESSPPWKLAAEADTGRTAVLTRSGEEKGLMRKPDVQLAMLPKAGSRRMITCQAALCTGRAISSIQWRPPSDEVLFTVTDAHEGQAQSIYRWDVGTGAVNLVTSSAGSPNARGRYPYGVCAV